MDVYRKGTFFKSSDQQQVIPASDLESAKSSPKLAVSLGALILGSTIGKRILDNIRLNRLMNGNLRLFAGSAKQFKTVQRLSKESSHVLRNWPRLGVHDDTKRSLIRMYASSNHEEVGVGSLMEKEMLRLKLLVPPMAEEIEHELVDAPNVTRQDPFYYLRDDDRKNSKVLKYLQEENEYRKSVMADTEQLQDELYHEMRGRIQEKDVSAPLLSHGYIYYTRTEEGEQYAVHCRKRVRAGEESDLGIDENPAPEEILLDENAESKGKDFYMVGGFEISPDHSKVAFGVDTTGNEKFTLYVRDLATGRNLLKDPIKDTDGCFAWSTDNETLFYTRKDELDRPYQVWRHRIGTDSVKDDVLVYHEKDEAFYLGIGLSRSEQYIYIHAGSAITSDIRYIKASEPENEFTPVLPRVTDTEYSVEDRGDQFFITVRDEKRFNSEILVANTSNPKDTCKVLIPHNAKVKIESVEVSAGYLAVFQRSDGLQRAVVYSLEDDVVDTIKPSAGKEIEFDEPTYELHNGAQGDFDSHWLRYLYTSFTTPTTVVDYNMKTGERAIRKVTPVLGGFDSSKYHSERVMATAKDGVKVPISLVYRKDLVKLDGSDPMLLDAYGSYEICNDADFRSSRLSLLDRGWLFGIAHVRGGGEMGREWYLDGKFLNKKNTFSDFIACAEYLADNKYTSPAKLSISGRSAGGLTMGASINESMKSPNGPHFSSAIAGVPFVDVLTTMLDETIPLTTIEFEEWGNPKEKKYYEYMKSYSPVDNIVEGKTYPNLLVTGGLHDPRVGYWEPAKYVANLRKKTQQGNNFILLKMDMGAGHFSKSGRFDKLKEMAVEFAFLLKCQGMIDTKVM